ncbi:MAG: energy-coupling factor transporter transmembrane component T family protein [Bacillota bacterium]
MIWLGISPGTSIKQGRGIIISRVDVRIKIICSAILLAVIGSSGNPYLLLSAVPPLTVLLILSGISWAAVARSILAFAPFILFSALIGPISGDFNIGWVSACGLNLLRIFLMTMVALLLTRTTGREELVGGLVYILSPLKFMGLDVKRLGAILGIGIKFSPLIVDEAKVIFRETIGKEGFSPCNAVSRAVLMLERLFLAAIKKADQLDKASTV